MPRHRSRLAAAADETGSSVPATIAPTAVVVRRLAPASAIVPPCSAIHITVR
jgi:hypothetical protein